MNIIEIKNLSKIYKLYDRNVVDRFKDTFFPDKRKRFKVFHALKDINLTIKKGEIIGIVGRNGAGKSTLLKVISNVTSQTSGSYKIDGKIVALLELGGGFNPEFTGKENIYFTCSLQGMSKNEIDKIYNDILDFSELGNFISVPVKKYSSGMKSRLGFSTSIFINPDILILDEVFSVGDEFFRRKCYSVLNNFFNSGKTIILASHNLHTIQSLCNRVILLDNGRVLDIGDPERIVTQYRNLNKRDKLVATKNQRRVFKYNQKSRIVIDSQNFRVTDSYLYDSFNNSINEIDWGLNYSVCFKLHINNFVGRITIHCILIDDHYRNVSDSHIIENIDKDATLEIKRNFISCIQPGIFGIKIVVLDENSKSIYIVDNIVVFRCICNKKNEYPANIFSE